MKQLFAIKCSTLIIIILNYVGYQQHLCPYGNNFIAVLIACLQYTFKSEGTWPSSVLLIVNLLLK